MQLWSDVDEVPADWPACLVTIGVFDGVHRGHRELIRSAVDAAAVAAIPSVVLTFEPNPVEVVGRGDPPLRLATLRQRLLLIEGLGVDAAVILNFDLEVAAQTPEVFAQRVLADRLHTASIVVGQNFRFGNRARGDVSTLTILGRELGFTVEGARLVAMNDAGEPISSSLIRALVADGDVAAAARSLARPHRVEGTVVSGDGRGMELGFPTANLDPTPLAAVPGDGVYAGRMILNPYESNQVSVPAAISIGTNPTFDGVERRVEAFAYDEAELDLYDQHLALDFVSKIRGQEKFATPEELVTAVERDIDSARYILGG